MAHLIYFESQNSEKKGLVVGLKTLQLQGEKSKIDPVIAAVSFVGQYWLITLHCLPVCLKQRNKMCTHMLLWLTTDTRTKWVISSVVHSFCSPLLIGTAILDCELWSFSEFPTWISNFWERLQYGKIWPPGKSKKSLTFKLYWNLPSVSTKMWSAYWKLHFYCTASSTGEAMAFFYVPNEDGGK